jgi:CRISPR-associated endonuclease/helicase Cas3
VEAEVVSESSLPAGQREGKDQAESGISFSAIAKRIEEAASASDLEPFERRQSVDAALELLCNRARAAGVDWLASVSERLLGDQRREPEFDEKERLIALVGSKAARGEAHTATETAQFRRGRPVTLQEHSEGVKEVAERFVRTLRLPDRLSKSIQAAAQYHDLGKADPRFQAWLRGVAAFVPTGGNEILAKSGAITPRNLAAIRRARFLAGYPEDARHEALSTALAMQVVREAGVNCDVELMLHLIASHHGHARPFFPVAASGAQFPVDVEVHGRHLQMTVDYTRIQTDPLVAERFWLLVRRYGWWGLAFLEALFRLADHRRSEQEEING